MESWRLQFHFHFSDGVLRTAEIAKIKASLIFNAGLHLDKCEPLFFVNLLWISYHWMPQLDISLLILDFHSRLQGHEKVETLVLITSPSSHFIYIKSIVCWDVLVLLTSGLVSLHYSLCCIKSDDLIWEGKKFVGLHLHISTTNRLIISFSLNHIGMFITLIWWQLIDLHSRLQGCKNFKIAQISFFKLGIRC